MSRIAPTLLLLPMLAMSLSAQTDGAVVTGVVRDTSGRPITGAEVFVGRTDKPVTTNDLGQFRFLNAPAGAQWVSARRIGYAPVRRSVRISRNQPEEIELTMEPLPVMLPELKVVERSGMRARRLEDFWQRTRSAYGGRFITGEDLERRNPVTLVQMVRPYLPYAALTGVERDMRDFGPMNGIQQSAAFGGARSGARCAPSIAFDGGIGSDAWTVEDIPVSLVEAVEVYRPRWTEIPVEYSFDARAARCGLVIIWTK